MYCGTTSAHSFSKIMLEPPPLVSPVEFAQRMAHELPLIFSGDARFGNPGSYYTDIFTNLTSILNRYHDGSIPVLAQSIADTINSCIGAGIHLICEKFETEGGYDVLHLRLQRLRSRTRSICARMHLIFKDGRHDCGPGFHRELFRNPRSTILNEVVRVCKIQLVPVIQNRLCREFEQHRDIEATSIELQQLATRFDTVGILPGVYPGSEPHTMGLAAAQTCARRLLPQLEEAFEAIVATITMSLNRHSDRNSRLHRVLVDQDIRIITPLLGSRLAAMQYCHTLAYGNIVGDTPALLSNCLFYFRR